VQELQRQGERNNCLNCGASIEPSDSFCANCGQKVDDNRLALKDVLNEFFENYLSLDSRFGRSVYPFLFKPGYLAAEFMKGKRTNFANPFRLYILCSIFFFFGVNSTIQRTSSDKPILDIKTTALEDIEGVSSETMEVLQSKFDERTKQYFNKNEDLSFQEAYSKMEPIHKKQLLIALERNTLEDLGILGDTVLLDRNYTLSPEEEASANISIFEIESYKDSIHLSDQTVYKRVVGDAELPFYQEIFYKRLIRIKRANEALLRKFIIGNLSIAMFVLIPLIALVLKLFYLRRKLYFVAHLIHTLYLQAFFFLLFGILLGLTSNFPTLKTYGPLLTFAFISYFLIYFYRSLLKVYQQSRLRTFIKSLLLLFSYFVLSIFVVLAEVLVSFLLF